jgi:hypothetical protein
MRLTLVGTLASSALLGGLAGTSRAATDLDLVPSQSTFVCGGTCVLGPLVGNPTDVVRVDGDVDLNFVPGPGGELCTRIAAMRVVTLDDLHLGVPCPPPMPPPLRVTVGDLEIAIDSNAFLRVPDGRFDCQADASILGG